MRHVPGRVARRLRAACDVVADRGLANTKIDDIAKVTGIPKATLYYYFDGKDEILAFLLNEMLSTIARDVATAVDGHGTARDRLADAVEAQLIGMSREPAAIRALVGDLGRATRLPAIATALRNAFHGPLEVLLREGVLDGSLNPRSDPATIALAIFGATTIIGLICSVGEPDLVATELAHQLVGVLMDGIATSAG